MTLIADEEHYTIYFDRSSGLLCKKAKAFDLHQYSQLTYVNADEAAGACKVGSVKWAEPEGKDRDADNEWHRQEDIRDADKQRSGTDGKRESFKPSDLLLAIGLLTGAWTQEGAHPSKKKADKYPGKRYYAGELEAEARQALGRLLRSNAPMDSAVRYHLAELFDGQGPHLSFDAAPMTRKITFTNRRAGEPIEVVLRDLHMVSEYWRLIQAETPHKRAVGIVCEKYGVKETAVKVALRRNPRLKPRAVKKRVERPS